MVPKRKSHDIFPGSCRTTTLVSVGILFLVSAASATILPLNSSNADIFYNGIHYQERDPLILLIEDNITISSQNDAGIDSSAPLVIRSPLDRRITVITQNNSDLLYGIKAPSVSVEGGILDIHVSGRNNNESGNAFGIYAGSGNVTISGGAVSTTVDTTGHKNKGIYASGYIVVFGGRISVDQRGGSNTFGLDGGDVKEGGTNGGIVITGGYLMVNSTGGANRNIGIDSKFGTVQIAGDPVLFIHEDEIGIKQNFAYNTNITTISGGKAVVFTSAGGNYTLREDAELTRDAELIPGRTFEIPRGRNLSISAPVSLIQPSGTTFLFGKGYGEFRYATSIQDKNGDVIYTGRKQARQAPAPLAGLLVGLGLTALFLKKK